MVIFFNTVISLSIPGRDSTIRLNFASAKFKYWENQSCVFNYIERYRLNVCFFLNNRED